MTKRVPRKLEQAASDGAIRLSISIPAADHADLQRTAQAKRVSLAWVVRDAIREYLKNQLPLLRT